MCDNESDSKHEEKKSQKIHSQAEQNQSENLNESEIQSGNPNQNQLAGVSNEVISSEIFKIGIDGIEEVLDYLSVYDLLKLRLTCKLFKKIIEYYIRTNYPRLRKFRVQNKSAKMFRKMDVDTIEWINKIYVILTDYFDDNKFPIIQRILNKVEKIEIFVWKVDADFYDCFLKYCNNLKCLSLDNRGKYTSYIEINYEWLNHQYPSLEYFHIDYIWKGAIDKYMRFFRLNPNIHAFSIKIDYLIEIGWCFVEAGIKFDRLYIDGTNRGIRENDVVILKRLYDAGFYKRLSITSRYTSMYPDNELIFLKLASIGMEILNVEFLNCTIPPLPKLKELNVDSLCVFDEKYENVKNNIERFSCDITYSNDILAFIGYFPKLKHFQIQKMNDTDKLDLFALNKERENLTGACKTTIYINEKVFLTTKWATMQTNFNLIELKRVHTCDWDRFFENNCGICGT